MRGYLADRLCRDGHRKRWLDDPEWTWHDASLSVNLLLSSVYQCICLPFRETTVMETTMCTGLIGSDFAGDLRWTVWHLLIGATRHGARAVLLWNLALDEHGNPHTGAGAQCRGVVMVTASGTVERNVEYYALGHASQFIVPGAHRIAATSTSEQIETVAFQNADGTTAIGSTRSGKRGACP